VWQYHFGRGLAPNASDFGKLGELPSHPELLDWLAVEFRESGWDVKRLIKLIVTSATYRQSSVAPREKIERDPANRRDVRVSLTPAGRRAHRGLTRVLHARQRDVVTAMTEAERAALRTGVTALLRALAQHTPDRPQGRRGQVEHVAAPGTE